MNENLFLISDFSILTDVVAPLVGKIDSYRIPFLTFVFAIACLILTWKIIKGNAQGEIVPFIGRIVLVCALLAAHKSIFKGMFWTASEFGSVILPSNEYIEFLETTHLNINSGFTLWGFVKSSIASIVLILTTMFHVVALKLFEIYRVFKLLFLYVVGPITLIIGVLPQRSENPFNYYVTAFEVCMWKPVAAIVFKLLMLLNGHFTELSFANPGVDVDFSEISATVNFFTVISFSAITIILTLKVPQLTHWIITKSSNAADDVMMTSHKLIRDTSLIASVWAKGTAGFLKNGKTHMDNAKAKVQGLSKSSNVSQFKKLTQDPFKGAHGKKLKDSKYEGLDFNKYHKDVNYHQVANQIKNWQPPHPKK
ncbi:MAG: hypothetical protein KDD46_07980 [Bdellovibrionales bacterium]|nr:hypothetical protein [Bdellovibrionales bacterium]